jgi:hypothetical protein
MPGDRAVVDYRPRLTAWEYRFMNTQVPRGIEVLVKKASVDPAFKAILLERRAAAADEIGLQLQPAEAAMLAAIPREQLETIIANTNVPEEHRRVFFGRVAAAMLAAVGAAAALPMCMSAGSRARRTKGDRPERPSANEDPPKPPRSGGMQPDRPTMPAPGGVRPG